MKHTFFILLSLPLVLSCAHSLKIASNPTAVNVYYLNENGSRKGLAGQTPLFLSETRGNENFYFLEFEKMGFVTQTIVIPQSYALGSISSVTITMREQSKDWFETIARGAFAAQTNDIVTDFMELQTRIIEGSDADVKRLIDKLKSKYDTLASFHTLVGAHHYSKNRIGEARASYEKAIKIDSNNTDAIQMIKLLKTMQ